MKPIFITDLDHTFLRSDLSVSDYTKDIWNQKANDAIMSVATARSFQKAQSLLSNIRINAPLILLDGAIILSPDRKLIELKTINNTLGDAIIEVGQRFDIDPFVIALKDKALNETFLYPKRLNTYQENVLEGYKGDPRLSLNTNDTTMEENLKLVYFGYEEQIRPLYNEIQKVFGANLETKLSPEKYGGGYFLTLLHPKSDKAHALRTVMEYLEREPSHVTVFGDSVNDIGMFNLSGNAVAVANALDEVKAVADVILPHTNDEDAVAKYLSTL